jgi:hypothetical protein
MKYLKQYYFCLPLHCRPFLANFRRNIVDILDGSVDSTFLTVINMRSLFCCGLQLPNCRRLLLVQRMQAARACAACSNCSHKCQTVRNVLSEAETCRSKHEQYFLNVLCRIPVGARFSAPFHTGPGMDTGALSRG